MNDNNYVLLPQVKIGFIYNNIQTVVPFVLDESLDVYNLLKKLVDYCNELGARSNELQYILKDLVEFLNNKLNDQRDYINNFLEKLHQEWLDYKDSLEGRYDEFTSKVDELFETYKNQIRDEYNSELANIRTNNDTLYNNLKTLLDNKITELTNYANSIEPNIDNYIDEKDQIIHELITNFQNEFTEYQKTVNAELIELGDNLTQLINTNEQNVINQINNNTQQIINTLNNVNMQELVNNKLNEYDSKDLSSLFTNLYGTLIRIAYMDTNTPPTVVSETPIYHYNPTTNVLTDCTTGNEVPLLNESLYLYEGRIFVPIIDNKFITIPDSYFYVGYNVKKDKLLTRDDNTGKIYLYDFESEENIDTNFVLNKNQYPRSFNFLCIYDEEKNIIIFTLNGITYVLKDNNVTEVPKINNDNFSMISSDGEKIYYYEKGYLCTFNDDYIDKNVITTKITTEACLLIGYYNNDYVISSGLIPYGNNPYGFIGLTLFDNEFNKIGNSLLGSSGTDSYYINYYNNLVVFYNQSYYFPNSIKTDNLKLLRAGYAYVGKSGMSNQPLTLNYASINNNAFVFSEIKTLGTNYSKASFNKYLLNFGLKYDTVATSYYKLKSYLMEIPYQRSDS